MKANPPPIRIPQSLQQSKEMAGFFNTLVKSLYLIWERTGGGSDYIANLEGADFTLHGPIPSVNTKQLAELKKGQITHLGAQLTRIERRLTALEKQSIPTSGLRKDIDDLKGQLWL